MGTPGVRAILLLPLFVFAVTVRAFPFLEPVVPGFGSGIGGGLGFEYGGPGDSPAGGGGDNGGGGGQTAGNQASGGGGTSPPAGGNQGGGGKSSDAGAASRSPPGGAGAAAGNATGDAGAPTGGAKARGRRAGRKSRDFETAYTGDWQLFSKSSAVSAMHMVILHHNRAIMFDATNFGPSQIKLANGDSRLDPRLNQKDEYAHAVEFDYESGNIRPLKVLTNPWCASGGMDAEGVLVQTGGWWDGGAMIRYIGPCANCEWLEFPDLARKRWYATQQILPDGRFIVIGGRREFNYEFVPQRGKPNTNAQVIQLPLLAQTNHPKLENNLYPFVHLSTDGNLFIFANDRSILLNPNTNQVVREFPQLQGGARNYPASGMSVLLPLNLNRRKGKAIPAEVLVCGGTPPEAMAIAEGGNFQPVLDSCGRLLITTPNQNWKMETMPKPRIMADMLLLPNADVILINGASKGSAGWLFARDPVFEPWIYSPPKTLRQRWKVLKATNIPRLYHSTSALLPDGKILVAGSNPNNGYNFTGVMYPTELRIEKFSPPYLDPQLATHRPEISSVPPKIQYKQNIKISFKLGEQVADPSDIKVTMYAQPFTTHGYSMNQRLLILKSQNLGNGQVSVDTPESAVLAPPGYYLLFVVHRGLPSKGAWVQIK